MSASSSTPSGHQIWVLMTAAVVRDGDGEPLYVIEQVQDISERKRLENKLRVTADHDALTGIRNRRLFEEDLFTQVGRCQRYGEHAALLLLDLDDFKQINDRYGHKTGDDTLKLVARTIKKRLRLPRIRSHGLVAMSLPPCFPTLVAGRPSSGNRAR